jgi:hypothetical protein
MKPWAEYGYECYAVDIATEENHVEQVGEGEINYVSADIHKYLPPKGNTSLFLLSHHART